MKSDSDIERTLEQFGRNWPRSNSIAESVLRRLEGEKRPPGPSPMTGKRSARALLAAAALLAMVGAWFYFGAESNSLSAQVIKAMDRAKSLDAVRSIREIGPNGEDRGLQKATEARFVEGQGFRYDWGEEIWVGNDTSFWRFNRRTKAAFRSTSGGIRKLLNDWFDVHKFALELQNDSQRDPAADTTVKNEHLRAYQLIPKAPYADQAFKEGRERIFVFLDSRSRIARMEELDLQNGAWRTAWVDEWSYDVPIDPKSFEPNFGPSVKIVDTDGAFDELVDLRQAVHVEDHAGLIYAVHRIERFEGGGLLVMSSVRGDEETLKKFPPERRMLQPGLYHVDGPATNYDASPQVPPGCFRIPLARASHQGIDLQWWIQIPRYKPANYFEVGADRVWIMAGITPWPFGKYAAAHRNARGVIEQILWKMQLKVPRPQPLPTLSAIAPSVYADMAALGALPAFDFSLDLGVDESSGQPVSKRGSPADTTPSQFAKAVEGHVRWWFRQDIESQFKFAQNQFKLAPNQNPKFVPKDTFALNYIPGVGDAELARLSSLTRVKRVYLPGTAITDGGLASLSGLSQLERLDLSDTAISDAGLEHLAGLHSLKELDLKNTHVTAQGIERLKSVNPRLKVRN